MVALVVGLLFLLFSVFSILPLPGIGLNWGTDVLVFLRGGLPIFTLLVGLVVVVIGITDLKDKADKKKRESVEKKEG